MVYYTVLKTLYFIQRDIRSDKNKLHLFHHTNLLAKTLLYF